MGITGGGDEASVDNLFREIWERESQAELRFNVAGVSEVRDIVHV